MHSLILNGRSGRLLMGGMQNKLVEFDLATGKETRVSLIVLYCIFLYENSKHLIPGHILIPCSRIGISQYCRIKNWRHIKRPFLYCP